MSPLYLFDLVQVDGERMSDHTHLTFPVVFYSPTISISIGGIEDPEKALEISEKIVKCCEEAQLSFLSINEARGNYEVYAIVVVREGKIQEICEKLKRTLPKAEVEPCKRFGKIYVPKIPLMSEIKGEKVMIFRRTLVDRMFQAMFEMFGFGASEFLKESAKKVGAALAEQYGKDAWRELNPEGLLEVLQFLISGCRLVGWIPDSEVTKIASGSYKIFMRFGKEWEKWATLFSITILEGVVEGFLEKYGIRAGTTVSREENGVIIYLKARKGE